MEMKKEIQTKMETGRSNNPNNTSKMGGLLDNFMGSQQNDFFKSLFQRNRSGSSHGHDLSDPNSPRPIPQLSPLCNSVVCRCSRILQVPTEELQHRFDAELPESVKQLLTYARNFLEFCSYQTLHLVTKRSDYLADKEFRRLMYDMMLAWEAPSVESEMLEKEGTSSGKPEVDDEDSWSLFYSSSTNMAVQVDENQTVGPEAFARIAPVCAAVADVITVRNLFDALTRSSSHRLHFLVYDKYLRSLDKVIKASKNVLGPSISNLQLAEGEIVLDIDGTVPTQPVLQHIGISAWPGRLTLTNYALYFESGVGLYDKAVRYDLAMDLKQSIKPELTGPLGARLFDKAVMYKSATVTEPVYLEFPEFKGNSRRDYWLDICLEILRAHKFIRKKNLIGIQQSEVLARATLGIFRYRAVREAFHVFSSNFKTLLAFNLAESLPGGDMILETLSSRILLLNVGGSQHDISGTPSAKPQMILSPVSLVTLSRFGFTLQNATLDIEEIVVGDVCVGVENPLEIAVRQSISETGRVEAARATVDQVKVEGIDTNLAVMKELLFPFVELLIRLQFFATWEDPFKSAAFLVLSCYAIYKEWIRYVLPTIFVVFAVFMIWCRHFNKGKPLEAFKITPPPNRNAVEQLLTLQEVISQVETLIQTMNIVLLKIRALIFAVLPQATDRVALLLVFMAVVFAFVPLKYLIMVVFLESFTREMPLRKQSSDRLLRRVREWWVRIPAAPVQLVKAEDVKKIESKKKK